MQLKTLERHGGLSGVIAVYGNSDGRRPGAEVAHWIETQVRNILFLHWWYNSPGEWPFSSSDADPLTLPTFALIYSATDNVKKEETGVLRRVYGSNHPRYCTVFGFNWTGAKRTGGGE